MRTDRFEVALVIGSCFLVNSVTQDAKTNWSEGLIMVSFYLMIVRLCFPQFSYSRRIANAYDRHWHLGIMTDKEL
jgi:hypothetical protein